MKSAVGINKFLKVIIATQRAKQILKGARALIQSSSTRATRIALEGVEQGQSASNSYPRGRIGEVGAIIEAIVGKIMLEKTIAKYPIRRLLKANHSSRDLATKTLVSFLFIVMLVLARRWLSIVELSV